MSVKIKKDYTINVIINIYSYLLKFIKYAKYVYIIDIVILTYNNDV